MKNNLKVHFSSEKQDWATPQDFFDKLNEEFDFQWDVCATLENTKVQGCFFDEAQDGLNQKWCRTASRFWMNPPYGREIGKWVKKASEESEHDCTIVALLPARTDTKYFHEYIYNKPNVEIRFIKGRLKFGGAKNAAPFPSMVVIFRP